MTTQLSQKIPAQAVNLQPPDPGRLAEQVARILSSDSSHQGKISQLLQLTVSLVNGAGAIFYREQEGALHLVEQLLSRQTEGMSADILTECKERAGEAIREKRASIHPLSQMQATFILSCPVASINEAPECCLTVLVLLGDSPKEPFLIITQLMAAVLSRTYERERQLSTSRDSSHGLLSVLAGMKKIPDLRTCCDVLRKYFSCSVLAVGSGQQDGRVRLKSVSDVVKVDPKTSQARLFQKVMQECLQQDSTTAWPALDANSAPEESLLVKELVLGNGMRQGVAVLLPGVSVKSTVLVFLWPEEQSKTEQIEEITQAAPLFGLLLQTLGSNDFTQPVDSSQPGSSLKNYIVLTVLASMLAGFILYPVTFRLAPDCQVVPVQIRYIVSRFDGLLEKVFVEPGDRVIKQEKLALLDGREVELELRSIKADSAKALKLRDNHLATGNVAAAQIGFLEYQRLQERASLLLTRKQHLRLESPVDGIVLSGELKRAVGGPITKGQVLFEVAPLEKILIELDIADADISYVKKQASVTVNFDAFPDRSWHGKIDRIAPKSVLFNGQNIFIASFEIVNSDNLLQPGMQGRGSVECGEKSLLWIYFHKPWYALIRLLNSLF